MTEQTGDWLILARRAGLDLAVEAFPTDVQAAAEAAAKALAGLPTPTDPADEPWPPMRVGAGS
jgi:hypothetical protein